MTSPKSRKVAGIVGLVLHVLIGGFIIIAGAMKLMGQGLIPKDKLEEMAQMGLADKLTLIGAGELIAGVLLIVPMTTKLGVLATSGFWGGVICFHLTHNDAYIPYAVALALTWVGAYLRHPETLVSVPSYEPSVIKAQAEV